MKKEYKIGLYQEGNGIVFAVLEDVNSALQLTMALHQSCNKPHSIKVFEDGVEIVNITTENATESK